MSAATRLLMTIDAVGGIWPYAADLAAALTPLGYEVILAALGPPPAADQRDALGTELIETGLALDWLAQAPEDLLFAGQEIAALAARRGADIVQLNHPAIAAKTRFDMPSVAVVHSCMASWWQAAGRGTLPEEFRWRSAAHGAGLAAVDRVIAPSRAFAEETARAHHLLLVPAVVHNGRAAMILPAAPIEDFVFTAGRLWDSGKNLATLDRAAARLAVPMVAAGSLRGPNGEVVQFDHLRTPGRIDAGELARRLACRPLFVSAAVYEPFGLAVLEAAAAGCALILSDIPTFRELWHDAAIFVPAHDDAGFAAAVTRLIAEPRLRTAHGARARLAAQRYTAETMAKAMSVQYREVLRAAGQKVAA